METSRSSEKPITPLTIYELLVNAGVTKVSLPWFRMSMLAILAGMYIGFGGILFLIVGTGTLDTWPYGVAKFLQGLAFCLGLVLVVVGGAELFTGNTLLIIPWLEKKISISELVRNWGIVYFGNFLGSLILAIVMFYSRIYMNANGQMAELLLKVAEKKVGFSFGQALMLGILCNILVCLAVWMAYSAKNTSDKILAILFPITAFIAAGFEHSVANMFLIPFALFIKWFDPSLIGVVNVENLSICNFLMKNLLPVTLGNIIGGSGFVGLFYYFAFHQKTK